MTHYCNVCGVSVDGAGEGCDCAAPSGDYASILGRYTITNTEGRTGGPWERSYETCGAAGKAIMGAMGWDGIWLSESFTVVNGDGVERTARCAYPDQAACDADSDGAYAPRVVLS